MSFETVVHMVLEHEGGYVNHPSDPGGETKYGISKRAYPDIDIAELTEEDAASIYKRDYWDRIKGDDLPAGVACAVMDYAVNSGISRASKALQSVCGISNGDGIIGPASLNAVWVTVKDNGEESVVTGVTEQRQDFIRGLSIYDTFGKGWERRINETHDKAMELIDNG
jgi:lysozyme family protein